MGLKSINHVYPIWYCSDWL